MTLETAQHGSWLVVLDGYSSTTNALGIPWSLQLLVIESHIITFYDPGGQNLVYKYPLKSLKRVNHDSTQSVMQFCISASGAEKRITFQTYLRRSCHSIIIFLANCRECVAVSAPTLAATELLSRFSIGQDNVLHLDWFGSFDARGEINFELPSSAGESIGVCCGRSSCRVVVLARSVHRIRLPNVPVSLEEDSEVDRVEYACITHLNLTLKKELQVGICPRKIWSCRFKSEADGRFAAKLIAARSHFRRFVDSPGR